MSLETHKCFQKQNFLFDTFHQSLPISFGLIILHIVDPMHPSTGAKSRQVAFSLPDLRRSSSSWQFPHSRPGKMTFCLSLTSHPVPATCAEKQFAHSRNVNNDRIVKAEYHGGIKAVGITPQKNLFVWKKYFVGIASAKNDCINYIVNKTL